MRKSFVKLFQTIFFIVLGIFLMWLVYKEVDIKKICQSLSQVNILPIIIALILGLLSHYSRAVRWAILIEPLGYSVRKKVSFSSILVLYMANFAIPRFGEVARCGVVSRYDSVPFSSLLGTVFVERAVDTVILFVLFFVVLLTNIPVINALIENNPTVYENFINIFDTKKIIIALIALVAFVFLYMQFYKKLLKYKFFNKIQNFIKEFLNALTSIFKLRRKWEFLFHSLFIWFIYWMMLYVMLLSMPQTKELSIFQALTLLVISSLGMLIPTPGGMGAWHFMTIETLFIYNIPKHIGQVFALVAHESQLIFLVFAGLGALIYLNYFVKNVKLQNKSHE